MNGFDCDIIMMYPGEKNSQSFARKFRALVESVREFFVLDSILFYETMVEKPVCFGSRVIYMERSFQNSRLGCTVCRVRRYFCDSKSKISCLCRVWIDEEEKNSCLVHQI